MCFRISCDFLSCHSIIPTFKLLNRVCKQNTFRDVMQDNGCHENTVNNMANSFPQQGHPFKTSLPPPPPPTVKCPPTTFHFLFFVSSLFCLTSRLVILQCNCCENSVCQLYPKQIKQKQAEPDRLKGERLRLSKVNQGKFQFCSPS